MGDPQALLREANLEIKRAERLLNAVQAAARLRQLGLVNICPKTVRAWGRKGVLRRVRVGCRHYYRQSEIDHQISSS